MVLYENSKSKTFIVGLEISIEKKLFIFQLHDRMPQTEIILERRGLKNQGGNLQTFLFRLCYFHNRNS